MAGSWRGYSLQSSIALSITPGRLKFDTFVQVFEK
jgi:hypothetical protein